MAPAVNRPADTRAPCRFPLVRTIRRPSRQARPTIWALRPDGAALKARPGADRMCAGRSGFRIRRVSYRAHERRSEEHTSELQSLMRISYAVFCLKKKTKEHPIPTTHRHGTLTNKAR